MAAMMGSLRRKPSRRSLHCLYCMGLLSFVIGGFMGFFVLDLYSQKSEAEGQLVSCENKNSINFISNLCRNYSKGLVSGSMCRPLCVTKELIFKQCLGHKITDLVMLAFLIKKIEQKKEQQHYVVLKAETSIDTTLRFHFGSFLTKSNQKRINEKRATQTIHQNTQSTAISSMPLLYDDYLSLPYHQNVTQLRKFMTQIYNISTEAANWILSECDFKNDGFLTNREAAYCWHMIDEDEILLSLSYESQDIAPKIFGVCGNLFVTEYVPTLPVTMPLVSDVRSWDFRARLAIGFIELTERIDALVEPSGKNLLLCDVQESNFGVLLIDRKYTVMSIDNDLSIFESALVKSLKFETNQSCISNDDCNFINCVVRCDTDRGKCSGQLITNNLQIICQRFFMSRHKIHMFPLLHDPPSSVQRNLKTLLHECVHPLEPSTRISKRLAKNLKKLLLSTLNDDWS